MYAASTESPKELIPGKVLMFESIKLLLQQKYESEEAERLSSNFKKKPKTRKAIKRLIELQS